MLLTDACLIAHPLSLALAHTWRRRRGRPQGVIARSIKTGVPCARDFTYPRANHTSAIPACRSGRSWMTAIRQLEGCISQRDHRLSSKRKRNSSKLVPCHIPPLPSPPSHSRHICISRPVISPSRRPSPSLPFHSANTRNRWAAEGAGGIGIARGWTVPK